MSEVEKLEKAHAKALVAKVKAIKADVKAIVLEHIESAKNAAGVKPHQVAKALGAALDAKIKEHLA